MERKKKTCAGCNTEQFIYKNIEGKKYCKPCTLKLEPPKPIRKRTEKQEFKMKLKIKEVENDIEFYKFVWYDRFGRIEGTAHYNNGEIDNAIRQPKCECCGARLWWEPNMMYFHHILEKRNYPELRHDKHNIAIVCEQCHNAYEMNPDSMPYLKNLKYIRLAEYEFQKGLLDARHIIEKQFKI